MKFQKSLLVVGLLALGVVGCSSRPPRQPNLNYLDEVKHTVKGKKTYLGLFTTQPVLNYSVDKIENPPSIVVSLDAVQVQDTQLPKRFRDKAIKSFTTNMAQAQGKSVGQVLIFVQEDLEVKAKKTEYGLRLDLEPLQPKSAQAEKPEEGLPTQSTPEEKELEVAQKTQEKAEEERKEDIKEAEVPFEPAPIKTEIPKTLESIARSSIDHKERLVLTCSEACDFQKIALDKEVIVELKNVKPGATLSPLSLEEAESFLSKVSFQETEAPYPSTKVTIQFKDSLEPQIQQNANLIYIDFEKPRLAKILEEEEGQTVIDFGNYLTSPSRLPGRKLSLQSKNTDIQDILRLLAETSDYNIISGKDVGGKVTIRLLNVPWDEALIAILQAHQLGFVKQGNIIRVSSLNSLKEEKEKAVLALAAKEKLEPLQVIFIPLTHRKAFELTRHLYPFLSERGSLSIDRVTNTVIIRDIPSVLKRTNTFVSSLDKK
ncbi:MAG: hypothetical protein HYY62_05260 [Deltaproteobacteria bacterium]|nr:hypothetical protein [Deltaproteobacteria bacterium]